MMKKLLIWTILMVMMMGETTFGVPTTKDFKIVSFSGKWECETLWIKGEVKNIGNEKAGVEIYYIIRDKHNKIVDSGSFWPYGVSNIESGQSVGLDYPASKNKEAKMIELRLKKVRIWE